MSTAGTFTLDAVLKQTLKEWHSTRLGSTRQTFDKLVVAAAVLEGLGIATPRILVVKRAPHEDYFPNHFEMPGGKIDDTGETIGEGLARELFEETGLVMTKVLAQLPEFTYTTEKTVVDEHGQEVRLVRRACQLNFAVEVEDGSSVKLDPREHSEWRWVDEGEVGEMHMTELMRECVANALAWTKSQQ